MKPSHTKNIVSFLFLHYLGTCYARKFTLINQCPYTIWPATLSGAGTPPLPPTANGFSLVHGASTVIPVPASWSGRVWARTGCTTGSGGNFSCATGTTPPATLAEFTLDGSDGLDFYDVSLVDGYNLPLVIRPVGGSGNCSIVGCDMDLNEACPTQLRVIAGALSTSDLGGQGVACKSACGAFGDPQYCCSGVYSTPQTCKPSSYSMYFKKACPSAYSYAYDDATSTFTCAAADYVLTFCPSATITKILNKHDEIGPNVAYIMGTDGKSIGTQAPQTSASPPYSLHNSVGSLIPSSTIMGLVIVLVWASLSII